MKKNLVIVAIALGGTLTAALPAKAAADVGPSTYGRCVADGLTDPQADEPPGQHWEYFWGCA